MSYLEATEGQGRVKFPSMLNGFVLDNWLFKGGSELSRKVIFPKFDLKMGSFWKYCEMRSIHKGGCSVFGIDL